MTLRETVEKRNGLLAKAREIMAAPEPTTEQRAKVDAMLADANVLKADIERLEASAVSEERSLPVNAPPRDAIASETEDTRTQEQRNLATNIAFRAYLRGQSFEKRDLTIAADGGVMVPTAALPPVQAQRSAGSMYDVVRHMRTSSGEPVRVPLWDGTTDVLVLDSTAVGTGNDPTISGITIQTDGLRTGDPVLIDNKLIADLSYDLVGYVNQLLTDRYTRGVSNYITNGNTSNFTGYLGAMPFVSSAVAATLGYGDFVSLVAALDPAYHAGACFAFSNTVLGAVLNIKDSQGRPIFIPYMDGAQSGFAGQILGFPVKLDQYGKTVATGNVAVAFGDFSQGYCLREVTPGLVIKQSNQRWVELNRLGVIGFARAGGAPTLPNATTYSPLQGLKIS